MKICTAINCQNHFYAKNVCRKHYKKLVKYGDPNKSINEHHNGCSITDCDRPHKGKSYCSIHYDQWKLHGDPLKWVKEKHGMESSTEYASWRHIKDRCLNPNDAKYSYYGGRGIGMCDEWRKSFNSFYRDMGKKPHVSYSIDRIDVNGNYEPSNCRWASPYTQAVNRRLQRSNTTGFVGVSKAKNKWIAYITFYGDKIYLGSHGSPDDAAYMRDQYAMQLDKDIPLNFEY